LPVPTAAALFAFVFVPKRCTLRTRDYPALVKLFWDSFRKNAFSTKQIIFLSLPETAHQRQFHLHSECMKPNRK
jgi:hypothetical protein